MRCSLLARNMLLVLGALSILMCAGAGLAADDFGSRVVVEGGLLRPLGELGADFDESFLGLGADSGYEVGFRFRKPVKPALSISPAFHFVDFESHVLLDAAENEFKTEAFSYRLTLEGMLKPRCGDEGARPFLAVAAGLYRNRVVGFYDDPTAPERDYSVNSFGYSVRWGFATENFELSFVAHRNRVETWRFFETDSKASYRWNSLSVRLGYILP